MGREEIRGDACGESAGGGRAGAGQQVAGRDRWAWDGQNNPGEFHPQDTMCKIGHGSTVRPNRAGSQALGREHRIGGQDHPPSARSRSAQWRFKRSETNPLACDLLVVDEVSMVDVPLMASLIRALPPEAGLLLVGDADQLPSVCPGQVLADIIKS